MWDVKGMVDGVSGAARFSTPYGVAVVNGKIIVADHGNHRVRAIGLDGVATTIAGAGPAGFADGAAQTAKFNQPQGLAAAANGDIYVTDLQNYRVRRISGDTVTTVAGSGTAGFLDHDDRLASQLYGLEGLSVTADGSMVFVADGGRGEPVMHNRIRSIKMK
jgi:DNA-binding beta-propeller fold protein YncE